MELHLLHYRDTILLINKVVKQFRFVVDVKDTCINTAVTSYSIKNYLVRYAIVLTVNAYQKLLSTRLFCNIKICARCC